jgi:hypothetical protein
MACTASILNLVRLEENHFSILFSVFFRLLLQLIGNEAKKDFQLNFIIIFSFSYIAVTKPLKYARHKNPKRVAIMIVIVWLVSFFIALPIVR